MQKRGLTLIELLVVVLLSPLSSAKAAALIAKSMTHVRSNSFLADLAGMC